MLLFNSLLCVKGYDNGRRFLLISLICYLWFFLLSPLLDKAVILVIFLFITSLPLLMTSSMRRIHDAGFATPLALVPVIVFILVVLGITYFTSSARWFLLLLAALVTALTTTIKHVKIKGNRDYIWGYAGPANMIASEQNHHSGKRVEPTILSKKEPSLTDIDLGATQLDVAKYRNVSHHNNQQSGFLSWVAANPHTGMILFIMILASLVGWRIYSSVSKKASVTQIAKTEQPQILHKIAMPDQFSVMMDQHDAVILSWQTDAQKGEQIYSALTAKADISCAYINFDASEKYPTMLAEVKNGGEYQVRFSPLDSADIVKAIAKRSRFKLCDFEFKLKGTQSRLMANKKYATLIRQP